MFQILSITGMIISFALYGTLFPDALLAEDAPSLGTLAEHDHKAIQVRSRPVIERLPVKVIEPVDLVLSGKGNIYVADRKAECIFRLDQHGSVSLMIEKLAGIERILVDTDDSLYVLSSSGGESTLHQITSNGQHLLLHTFDFPASSFARDELGCFSISVAQSGRVISLSAEGEVSLLAQLSQPVVDLIRNAGGQLEALLPSGHIVRIAPDQEPIVSGFAEMGSKRLASLEDGTLLSLANTGATRFHVSRVVRDADRPEQFECFATVPTGTNAVGFDSLGNLCLANADLRAVTRVTSQFEIACPHCGKPTKMIFSSEPDPAIGSDARSF